MESNILGDTTQKFKNTPSITPYGRYYLGETTKIEKKIKEIPKNLFNYLWHSH